MIDFAALDKIDIYDIARRLGIEGSVEKGVFHCPNKSGHNSGDKNPSMQIFADGGFQCYGCGVKGKRLDLVKLALNCSDTEASEWLQEQYNLKGYINNNSEKVMKPKKYPVRIISRDSNFRWVYVESEQLSLRDCTNEDLLLIRQELNKTFTLDALKLAGVKFGKANFTGRQIDCLVFPDTKLQYQQKAINPTDNYVIVEGRTDFVSALSLELHRYYNIIGRISKKTSYDVSADVEKFIYILDVDDDIEGAVSKCNTGIPKNSEVYAIRFDNTYLDMDFADLGIKDLSDFVARLQETASGVLISIIDYITPVDKSLYSKHINEDVEFCFWDNNGEIDGYELFKTIQTDGFGFLRDIDKPDSEGQLGLIKDNIIDFCEPGEIHNYVLNDLVFRLPEEITPKISRELIRRNLFNKTNLFELKRFNILPNIKFRKQRDTKDEGLFYGEDKYIIVSAEKIDVLPLSHLTAPIYRQDIKESLNNFSVSDSIDYYDNCIFDRFLQRLATFGRGTSEEKFDISRYNSLKSTIGYLLHKFRSPILSKAVIWSEDNVTNEPHGRTGKGLMSKALSYLLNNRTIDGKEFDLKSQFAWQQVREYHNLINIEDATKYFNFEQLFSKLTDGFEYEAKFGARVSIPAKYAPNISISTNYDLMGENSGSFRARIHEMELYTYYNVDFTPAMDFGHFFFDDWDAEEWNKFYNFMFGCLQEYLREGLQTYESTTLPVKKVAKYLKYEGYLLLDELLQEEASVDGVIYLEKDKLLNQMQDATSTDDKSFKKNRLTKGIQAYCENFGYELNSRCQHNGINCYGLTHKGEKNRIQPERTLF